MKTWDLKGQHVLDQHGIWKFSKKDLKLAIMTIAYPSEDKYTTRVQDLVNLILERFENDGLDDFYKWSKNIHNEIEISPPLQLLTEGNGEYEDSESDEDEDGFESTVQKNRKRIAELENCIAAFRATCVPGKGAGSVEVNIERGNHFIVKF